MAYTDWLSCHLSSKNMLVFLGQSSTTVITLYCFHLFVNPQKMLIWRHACLIPTLRKLRQESGKFNYSFLSFFKRIFLVTKQSPLEFICNRESNLSEFNLSIIWRLIVLSSMGIQEPTADSIFPFWLRQWIRAAYVFSI